MGCWTPPFGNPQVLAGAADLAELLAACAAGASVPLGKARARARSPRWPHLHRFVWGLRPLAPCVPQGGKSACHARTRMVPRPIRLASNAFASLPEAPAATRLGVPSLPSRGCAEGTLARPQWGNPKGGAALFGQSLPTFCWSESGGPARPERVEGQRKIFKKRRRRTNKFPNRKAGGAEALKSAPSASKDKEKFLRKGAGEQTSFPTEKPGAPKPLKVHRARRRTKKNF